MAASNSPIIASLTLHAQLLDVKGESSFKIAAYKKAADALLVFDKSIIGMQEQELAQISGIGKSIAASIAQADDEGRYPALLQLFEEVPESLSELLSIPGLGPKKVKSLWKNVGITSCEELEDAINNGTLQQTAGFGAKAVQNIKAELALRKTRAGKYLISAACSLLVQAVQTLLKHQIRAHITGEARRYLPVVTQLALVVEGEHEMPADFQLQEDGFYRYHGASIKVIQAHNWQSALLLSTGSKQHLSLLDIPDSVATEEEVYQQNKLPYIIPELREDVYLRADLELLASRPLVSLENITGALHTHSVWSDGRQTIGEMAEACIERGWSYLGITDHSQTAIYANGLTPERVFQQAEEVKAINASIPHFRIFHGIESDILRDGSLDYTNEVLSVLDFVIVSVHSAFGKDKVEATIRLVKAIEHPATRILGHATGRLLLRREGYPIDHAKVIDAAKANGVAIELNCNPNRMDMDWTWLRHAADKGVSISINTDAHKTSSFDYTELGVHVARKAGLSPDEVLNCRPLNELERFFS